jgi:putative two-component system response regulator
LLSERLLFDSKILIVDDNASNVLLVERLLEWAGYSNVKSATNGEAALALKQSYGPDLIILDLHMPGMDGYEVMRRMREGDQGELFLPILVFTADTTAEARQKALNVGASDFLTKPGEATEVSLRVRNFLHTRHLNRDLHERNRILEQKVGERTRALWSSQVEVLERLAKAAELCDDDAGDHSRRIGEMSARIAETLGWDKTRVELLRLAAPLHDVGKVGLPEALLTKPGKLTAEEAQEVERHSTIGGDLLAGGRSPLLLIAEQIARHHHERWDGAGYPQGLTGEAIPEAARIVAVADEFDCLTNSTGQRKAVPVERAMDIIAAKSGTSFDPAVVAAFASAFRRTEDREALGLVA